jgi:hypothetical protein
MSPVPALLPLSILQAVQNIDTPQDDGLGALEDELASKRLGLSPTVAAQVARYREQAKSGGEVSDDEALAVFRLVGRRPAARYAAKRLGTGTRGMIAAAPGRTGVALVLRASARLGRRWLLADVQVSDGQLRCEMTDSLGWRARDDGTGCHFYTSALAELLRQVGDLEWSVLHELCRGRGDRHCLWRAMRAEGYE